ncbi:MAG: M48 family metallopeptidase [Betaproteobacteria bacterium]|nr:M48 family metallopeptidase [Betaproteobacteria bacterium]
MKRKLLISLVLAALAAGCQTVETTKESAVGVDRKQHMMVSSDAVNQSADKAYADVLKQAQQQNALDKDPATVARVKAIASRLIPATGALRSDAPGWKWEIHVLSTKEVNAWCMPGGKIAVYTGLIDQLHPTDGELAAVMGHEIGHALREHGREQASRQMVEQVGAGIVGALTGVNTQLAQTIADVTIELPHDRTQETEADRIGVELMARAGYDPHEAVNLWQKMSKLAGGGQPPQFLSTHPSNESRIADVTKDADKVMPLYQAAAKPATASAGK